jgi:hypothetical protein
LSLKGGFQRSTGGNIRSVLVNGATKEAGAGGEAGIKA